MIVECRPNFLLIYISAQLFSFDLGERNGEYVSYGVRSGQQLKPDCIGEIFKENKWTEELSSTRRARLICPSDLFAELKDSLRKVLNQYVDFEIDEIGHILPLCSGRSSTTALSSMMIGTRQVSSLTDFSEGLIKAAAVVGSDQIVTWIDEWNNGEPVKFYSSKLLKGLRVKRTLMPMDCVRVWPLARSSDELPGDLPGLGASSLTDFLDRTVLSVDSVAKPGLFHPNDLGKKGGIQVSHVQNVDIDAVCYALALEYDTCVEQGRQWNHYPLLGGLTKPNQTIFYDRGLRASNASERHRWIGWTESEDGVALTGEAEPIPEIDEERFCANATRIQSADGHVRVAVERWMKSKGQGYTHDQDIDVRIALEALYLTNIGNERDRGELRFRVALRGAWYLGKDPTERRDYFEILREAYDKGSMVVHTGRAEKTSKRKSKGKPRKQAGSSSVTASELCRRGILKRVGQKKEPDWTNLVLGCSHQSVS